MDAGELLAKVASTYAGLKSLAVEALVINESGDADDFNRAGTRTRAFFLAPDRVRTENGRSHGVVNVADGSEIHTYWRRPGRYSRLPHQSDNLPGLFRPEVPAASGFKFLFHRVNERVMEAKSLRDEILAGETCHVISVTYEPPPARFFTASPLELWVNSRTYLIARLTGQVTHLRPPDNEPHTNKLTLEFTRVAVNEVIPPETFQFIPPEGATEVTVPPPPRGGIISTGGHGFGAGRDAGGWHFADNPEKGMEFRRGGMERLDGNTHIQRSGMRLHGVELAFERRMTFFNDRKELRIVDRITGPKGATENEIVVPL